MKHIASACLAALLAASPAPGGQNPEPGKQALPPAPPLLSKAVCGRGAFVLAIDGKPAGRETFEVLCREDGYSASGHTSMKIPGFAQELDTVIELDRAAVPGKLTVKGTVNGTALEQVVTLQDGTSTVLSNGETRQVPYTKGAALAIPNVFYLLQFVAARYDTTKAGKQQISLFPNVEATIERVARDTAEPAGLTPGTTAQLDRYEVGIQFSGFTFWADAQGRVALVLVPNIRFTAVREEYAAFVDPLTAALVAAAKPAPVDYSAPPGAAFTAQEVTVKAKGFTLAGTLLVPKGGKGPFPAVITVTGSGQQTRDERIPIRGLEKYRPFRQIAESLASRGVAVLRVDDRGVGESTGAETLARATSFDFADDVRAQIAFLRARKDIDPARIALVGHSEGGVIAPVVAASDRRVAAIVLLAGTGKSGGAVLEDQLRDVLDRDPALTEKEKAAQRDEQRAMLKAVAEGGDLSMYPDVLQSPWMKTFITYDPLTAIRKVKQPILILQGALDRQVTAEQAGLLERAARAAGNKNVTARTYPTLNHLFLPARTGAFAEYTSLETTELGADVLGALGDWLVEKLRVR